MALMLCALLRGHDFARVVISGLFAVAVTNAQVDTAVVTTQPVTTEPSGTSNVELRIVPRIYPSIAPLDVDRWCRWMTLSRAQRMFFESLYEDYAKAYSNTVEQHFGDLVRLSREVELALAEHGVFSADYADAFSLYVSESQKMNSGGRWGSPATNSRSGS
jgi:hypothetical protein